MDISLFRSQVKILDVSEARAARIAYLKAFVDTESDWYKAHIAVTRKCSDGECYEGYLWDCLKSRQIIGEQQFLRDVAAYGRVLVMWDIHSKERILIEDYWKFDKAAVLELQGKVLVGGMALLPEDLYVFDRSYSWSLISTHEDDGINRIFVSVE